MTGHKLLSFDATPIFYRRFSPDAPKSTLIIVHGMAEHGGRYKTLAEHLLPLGIESVVPDLRGFGLSGGARAYVPSFDHYLKDLEVIHQFILREKPGGPVFLFGHSLGGLISAHYAAQQKKAPLRGLLLSSPAFGVAVNVPLWKHYLALAVSRILPRYSEADNIDMRSLTHDSVILKEYERDPLIYHRITVRLYREMTKAMSLSADIAVKLTLPLLVLQAGKDAIVKKEATLAFYDQVKSLDKELEVYPELYHEILNEVSRDLVLARITSWLFSKS